MPHLSRSFPDGGKRCRTCPEAFPVVGNVAALLLKVSQWWENVPHLSRSFPDGGNRYAKGASYKNFSVKNEVKVVATGNWFKTRSGYLTEKAYSNLGF
ncbi:hypothetical protein [Aquimarina intermedia]|uniref:hypothetical protein n=1 Tax=Aquimarina intermedia TaxID=350814 RepID=UPI0011E89FD5|nr:hypothetical protein [Aquimarina intermedia]